MIRRLLRSSVAQRAGAAALIGVPTTFLGYFFIYPLVTVLATGLVGGDQSTNPIVDVLGSPSLRGVAWFTLWQAVASTALTLMLGIPGAYVLARYEFWGRRFIRAAVTVPFVLPTVVVGTAFLVLLGPDGPLGIDLRRTVWAILIAHVFYNYAVVVRVVGAFWEQVDPRLTEAARVLGATRWRAFVHVTLPLIRPSVLAAASIVFLFTFTSFGVVLILGGFGLATLEVEIYTQATALLDLPAAAALSLLQLVGIGGLLLAYSRFQQRATGEMRMRAAGDTRRRIRGRADRWIVIGNLLVMAVALGSPLLVLLIRSVRAADGFTLGAYTGLADGDVGALAVSPLAAVGTSLRYAAVASVIAVIVGLAAAAVVAYRRGRTARVFDAVLMLPLGTSAVTIGFGFLLALDEPIDLRTSIWLIPLAHALVAIPFVVRSSVPVMRSVRTRLREAAATLGADPLQTWREVDLPLVGRAALVATGFAFAISLGEFGATSFIARPGAPTLPVAIFRLLGQPGSETFGRAMALSVILMVLTGGVMLVLDRFRFEGRGEF